MIKDRITAFIWGQYGKPSGLIGRLIGNGKPGEITARIRQRFHEITQTEGNPCF